VLTDRWPEVPANQNLMIEDLHDFTADMRLLRSGTLSIDKMGAVLERMFARGRQFEAQVVARLLDLHPDASLVPGRDESDRAERHSRRRCRRSAGGRPYLLRRPLVNAAAFDGGSGCRDPPFPAFRQTCPFDFMGMWRDPCGLARTYEIRIAAPGAFRGAVIANSWITVEVLDPVIGLDPRGTGEKPPHLQIPERPPAGRSACTTRGPGMGARPADRRDHHPMGGRMAVFLRGLADRRQLGRRR
jgi:hypothetical protein